jgi:hypothetical protein
MLEGWTTPTLHHVENQWRIYSDSAVAFVPLEKALNRFNKIYKMTDLQKEFEATGYSSWINSELYPDGKIYTQEYTKWLEQKIVDTEFDYNSAIIEELQQHETLNSLYDVVELAMLICAKVNAKQLQP